MPIKYLNTTAPSDNTTKVAYSPTMQIKQKDTPARREKETAEYKAAQEKAKYTPANPRQASIGPYREKTALDKTAGKLYAAGEDIQKQEENMRNAGIFLGNLAELTFAPVMSSTYVDMVDAYHRGKRGFWDVAGARFTDKDAWSKRNFIESLALDIGTPLWLLGTVGKVVKGAGIPIGNGAKWHLKLPINENYYYRQGNNLIADAENTGVIAVKSKPSKDFVTSKGHVFNFGKTFDVPFFSKGSPWYGTNNKLEVIVNTGKGNYDWMPITKGGRFRSTADRSNSSIMSRVTPLVNGEAGVADVSDFIGFTPKKIGYVSRPLRKIDSSSSALLSSEPVTNRIHPLMPVRSHPLVDIFRLQFPTWKSGSLGFGHKYRAIGRNKGLEDAIENGIRSKSNIYNSVDEVYWAQDEPLREYTKNSPLLLRYDKNGNAVFRTGNNLNPVSSAKNPISFWDPNVTLHGRWPFYSKYHLIPKTEEGLQHAKMLNNLNKFIETPVRKGVWGYLYYKLFDSLFNNENTENNEEETD